jgi:hypothetical protein
MVLKPEVAAMYLNGLNNLKMGVRIFGMIQEVHILQLLGIQEQSQMSIKW